MTIINGSLPIYGVKVTITDFTKDTPFDLCIINSNSQILDIFVIHNKALAGATLEFKLNSWTITDATKQLLKTYYTPADLATVPTTRKSVAYDASVVANEKLASYPLKDVLVNTTKRLTPTIGYSGLTTLTLTMTLKGADATGADITVYVRRT